MHMGLLSSLPAVKKEASKRVGRGYGSGVGGHTSGRGTKGHTARTGGKIPLWFEGGQLPLIKRLPMLRGKGRLESLKVRQEVQLAAILERKLETITPETLAQAGLIRAGKGTPRLIGAVALDIKLTVTGVEMSQPVRTAIEKAGGTITE